MNIGALLMEQVKEPNNTNRVRTELFVKRCEQDFIKFLNVGKFPPYNIAVKEISLDKSLQQGFDSVASAFYDYISGDHRLEVWSSLYLPQMNSDYLLFHEFTHIWDAECYAKNDKTKYVSNKGYTEYHAAQIDFMKILGADSISSFSFSMKDTVKTFAQDISAYEFLIQPHRHASELISRDDFPKNIEALAVTLGLIFNYYGRRSICLMYAEDYKDDTDNTAIESLIHNDTVNALNDYMQGWFTADRVNFLDNFYYRMAISLAQQYHLA